MLTKCVKKRLSYRHLCYCNTPRKGLAIPANNEGRLVEVRQLLYTAIDKANNLCGDDAVSDMECMIQWDEVQDLTKAYFDIKAQADDTEVHGLEQIKIDVLSGFDEGDEDVDGIFSIDSTFLKPTDLTTLFRKP